MGTPARVGRPWWLGLVAPAAFGSLTVMGLFNGGWFVPIAGFGLVCSVIWLLAVFGARYRWRWVRRIPGIKLPILLVVFALIVTVMACSGSYDYTGDAFQQTVPQLIGMQVKHDTDNGLGAKCVLGLGITGAGAVGTALMPPAGIAAWVVYGALAAGTGYSLSECWDEYNGNREWFEVYTQCQGQPVLTTTLTDFNQVGAVVSLPSCKCRIVCIFGQPQPAFYDPLHPVPVGVYAATSQWYMGRNYYHDGANRVNGPVTEDPPPADWNAMAASMGLTYAGCVDTGGYNCTPR